MKLYVHYEEGASEDLHTTLKLTLPKKWVSQPILQVLEVGDHPTRHEAVPTIR
jgi:hypothetical protein